MTSPVEDPWAAANAQTQGAAPVGQGDSQAFAGGGDAESQLFSSGSVAPSLFNKTHLLGTERTGIITKAPYDRQKVDYNTKKPLFWGPAGGKPVPEHVDSATGQPNRPVMDTFLELSTDYTMSAAEAAATGRETAFEGTERVFVAGGFDLKELRKAMGAAVAGGMKLQSGADMVGKRLTVKRVSQKANPGGNPSWILEIKLSAA